MLTVSLDPLLYLQAELLKRKLMSADELYIYIYIYIRVFVRMYAYIRATAPQPRLRLNCPSFPG